MSVSGTPGAAPEPAEEYAKGTVHPASVLYVHFPACQGAPAAAGVLPGSPAEERYERLLALLGEVTPVVQPLPPDAALADVRGALRHFGRDAVQLARMVRLRSLARHGADCTIGVATNVLLARMVAEDGPPGAVRIAPGTPEEVAAFLAGRPAAALPGIGPATARTLACYGLDRIGRIAAVPPGTLQRILGTAAGRRLHERARGIDPAAVVPGAPARSARAEYRFGHDELDTGVRQRALLTLADELGLRMRTAGLVARTLTLTVRYADRTTTTRTRTLPEPTAHTPALTAAAYALHEALALQRARVRTLSLRAGELTDAGKASRQLSLDPREEKARRIEAAADRVRARFGPRAAGPAGILDAA